MKEYYEVKIFSNAQDLQALLVYAILAVIAQIFLLFVLSWNIVAIVGCIIISILLLISGIVDWLYFKRTVILNAYGCTFISSFATKTFSWESIYLLHTKNSSFFFGNSETHGEGVIISVTPISKPMRIGAMTYCRFTHPATSVFIRFKTPLDESRKTSAKFFYTGFTANKTDILSLLQHTNGCDSVS